jgi:hypothetical protein
MGANGEDGESGVYTEQRRKRRAVRLREVGIRVRALDETPVQPAHRHTAAVALQLTIQPARRYYKPTGKPLGITGEVAKTAAEGNRARVSCCRDNMAVLRSGADQANAF